MIKKFRILLSMILGFALLALLPAGFAQSAPPCSLETDPSQTRVTGLASSVDLDQLKVNVGGQVVCVENERAAFVSYKLPTYDDLKSLYFTQSKAPKVTNTSTNLASIAEATVYNHTHTQSDIQSGTYSYSATAIIFIDGSIYINGDIKTTDVSKGLVLVVKNNVNIDRSVRQIDAVIISSGPIYTAGVGCSSSSVDVGLNNLTVNGSLISLDLTNPNPIIFCRTLSDNSQSAEKIVHQPKYLVILKDLFSDPLQKWSEIQ